MAGYIDNDEDPAHLVEVRSLATETCERNENAFEKFSATVVSCGSSLRSPILIEIEMHSCKSIIFDIIFSIVTRR
jgi:hypothetical protein